MHSFKLVQVLLASLAAANVAAGLQLPGSSSVVLRSVRLNTSQNEEFHRGVANR